jgi:hypothetical protein
VISARFLTLPVLCLVLQAAQSVWSVFETEYYKIYLYALDEQKVLRNKFLYGSAMLLTYM